MQQIYEYGTILDIDNTQDLRKTIENWEQSLNSAGVVVSFENQQEIYEFCKSTLRGTVLQFFKNMEQENSSYFQEVRNNFSISVFINLIKVLSFRNNSRTCKRTRNIPSLVRTIKIM